MRLWRAAGERYNGPFAGIGITHLATASVQIGQRYRGAAAGSKDSRSALP